MLETPVASSSSSPQALDAFQTLTPILPFLLNAPKVVLWATDTEKWRMFHIPNAQPQSINIKPGDPLKPHDTASAVLKSGQMVSRPIPREVHGVNGHSIAIPVPGGVIGTSYTLEKETAIKDAIELVEGEVRQIRRASDDIAEKAHEVTTAMGDMGHSIEETHRHLALVEELGNMIEDLAEQSRFIALNALIEAARAGAHGTTFAVVAQQMQALSEKTTHSIKNVRDALDDIQARFEQVRVQTADTATNLTAQSVASAQIIESIKGVEDSVHAISALTTRF